MQLETLKCAEIFIPHFYGVLCHFEYHDEHNSLEWGDGFNRENSDKSLKLRFESEYIQPLANFLKKDFNGFNITDLRYVDISLHLSLSTVLNKRHFDSQSIPFCYVIEFSEDCLEYRIHSKVTDYDKWFSQFN